MNSLRNLGYILIVILFNHTIIHSQTLAINYQPSSLGTCLKSDTIVVNVTNSTLGTLSNLKYYPILNGFNFTGLVPVTGVSVTNGSISSPEFTISSLAPGANVRIKYFIQPGCFSSSTVVNNELKNSSGTLLTSLNTGIINVVFPAINLVGVSNTNIGNQSPAGFLQNLSSGKIVVRGFNLLSTNSVVGLSKVKVTVVNSNKHYQFIGINKGIPSNSANGDTITYSFNGPEFTTVGDGDTILEAGENFYFYDTMKVLNCNTSLPSNLGLKYYATYSCFVPSYQFCAKSVDVNALGEAKVVAFNLAVHRTNTDNGIRSDANVNNFSYCKSWSATTTYRNNTNNGGIPGAGILYDLDIFQSSSDWPFTANNQLIGFAKNNDGSYQYVIDSILINGVKVNLKDTFSSASGTIFNSDTTNWSKVKKVIKLTASSYTSPTPNGLKDLDRDSEIDDLAEGDSFAVKVFYRMNGNKFTSLVNNRAMEAYDDALIFSYQQAHTSVYYKNMCKEPILPRHQQNLFYNFHHFNQYEVGGTEDFYGGGAQHTMFIKYWNQYNFPYSFADTHRLVFKTILPPGINYVPNSVGTLSNIVPTKSYYANPGAPWTTAAKQIEVDGPGDYDTLIFVFNNSVTTYNLLYTIPFKVTLDCDSLADPCADLYPTIPAVQDSIKSYINLIWITDGNICYNELLMKDASPIRKHCPVGKKGLNMSMFNVKRETIGYLPDYRMVKITSSSPYFNSIDYSQTIPYDTVKYTMKGFIKDTSLNNGWYYLRFKNLYDNLDTIKILPTSTIRIFDVSSATNYTFLVKNSIYTRPSSGSGLVAIEMGAFVDSIRALGNTTFLLGGSVGSNSYQQDSFIIELYGVLTHNTQKEPYLNTQRDINPIAELKNTPSQINQDCDQWGRSLKVVQFYHGIPNIDYVPELATTGVCENSGYHAIRWYYWHLATPDYFPHETRYSIRLMDTISWEYNPIYIDSIFGPNISSFLRFGNNPANSATLADSNNFDRYINFTNTFLPANQRLIERFPNRIVLRVDSIFNKIKPTYTSDEYHFYNFGFFFRPTCAFPVNIPYQYHNTSPGDFLGGPLVKTKGIYWHNRQMPRIFDSTFIPLSNQWRSYSTQMTNPIHNISANPSTANIAQKDTIEWIITVSNTSAVSMPKSWLDFRARSSNIFKVVDLSTNVSMPMFSYTVGTNNYSWSQVGMVGANSSRQFKVFAKLNGCSNDTLTLREGFNCSYYPDNPELGYLPPYNYKCTMRENSILLPIQILKGHIQIDGVTTIPSSGNINICDTITLEFKLSNLGDVDLNKVVVTADMPIFSSIQAIADSAWISWPLGSSFQKLNVNPTILGGNYSFNLGSKFKNGFLPNRLTSGDSSKATIKLKFKTSCPFRTGAQVFFKVEANQPCGSNVYDLGYASNQLNVIGLPSAPTNTMLILEQGTKGFNICADSGSVEFKVKHTSGSKSNRNQFMQIELPNTIQYDTSNIFIQNSNKLLDSIPDIYTIGNKRIAEWRFDTTMVFGDSFKIKIKLTPNQGIQCDAKEVVKLTVIEKINLTANCVAGGVCPVDMILDSKFDTIRLYGPDIRLSNLIVSSIPNPPFGEIVTYSVQVKNHNRKSNNIKLKLLGGFTLLDSLNTTAMFSVDSGATISKTGSIQVPYGKLCSLKVQIDSTSCNCNYYPSVSAPYNLKSKYIDTSLCHGSSIWIGNDSINGFTYLWNNGISTSKQQKQLNNIGTTIKLDTNILSFNRGGCQGYDTFLIRTQPKVIANAGPDSFRFNCIGDSVQLGTNAISNHTYLWSPSTGLTSTNSSQPFAKPNSASQYFLTVTNTVNGCTGKDTVSINVFNSTLSINSKPYIRTCKGGPMIDIGGTPTAASGIPPYFYLWTPSTLLSNSAISNPILTPSQGGNYTIALRVTDSKGCLAFDTTILIIDTLPHFAAGKDTFLCQGFSAVLGGPSQAKINYFWSPSANLNSSSVSNPLFNSSAAGLYSLILTLSDSAGNCSLKDTVSVLVSPNKKDTITHSICKGHTYTFNNIALQTSGVYYDTLLTTKNCDSFLTLILIVKDTSSKTIYDTICSNQIRLFNGQNRTTTGIYKDTLTNAQGCDSFLYLNLFVKPISNYSFNVSICNNNPYNFNGQNLTTAGTYFDTLINSQGCDSFVTLNLSVNATSSYSYYVTICSGQGYNFNGQNRTTSGTYLDTLVNTKNCDSFFILNLTVLDSSTRTIFDTICKNQTRSFNNLTLNTTGIYKDTLMNSQGCDSFLYLNLLVKDTTSKIIFDTICSNQSKLFNGINRTTTGIYKDTLTNAQGCDSFLYLNLFVKPISNYSFNASICNNNPYNFNGQNLTVAGTYFDTLINSKGCDSFVTLNLSVSATSSHTLNISICKGQSYTFNGQNRTTTGTYLDTLVNAKNCDSFLTLNLTVKDTSTKMIYDTICKNQTRSFNNLTLNTTGIYKDTLMNSQGCDSFLYLNLLVKDTTSKIIFDTICSNQSKLFNGINRTTTGIYKDTLTNVQGCDSFLYLNLFVKPISNYSFNASICNNNPFNFNGQNLTTAGTYYDTLINSKGCDSFVTLNLSVSVTSSHTLNISICKGQVYNFNGQNRTTTGTYLDTLINTKNCDSFLTLNLMVKDTSAKTIYDTICKNQTRSFNNQTLNTTGIYKDTLTNAQGCDSFLYLNLLVKDTSNKQLFDTICSNQTRLFNGINRTTTGIYRDTLSNSKGCDSFLYLNLFVKSISNYSFNASICNNNPYNFNGQNLTVAGTYFDTLINSKGCDSFITLNLSVSNTTSHALNIAICKGQFYTFNGQNRTTTGTYLDTLVNAKNCDSFLTLNLTVKDTSTKMIYDTICKNQTRSFNNQTLNTTGIYKDTLTNTQGCDSFLYLNLLVKDTTKKDSFRTICKNQSLLFNGNTLNISGIYKDTFVNSKGCDSFVYLHITVKDTTKKDSFLKICRYNPVTFNGQILSTAGTYKDTLINAAGCDSFLYLHLIVNETSRKDSFRVICKNQSIIFNGNALNVSGIYKDTLVNSQGCDSFVYLHLSVNDTSSKVIYDTICKNQIRNFNNQLLNTTGFYKDTLTNAQGCDSFLYLNLTVKDTSSKVIYDTICSNYSKLFNGVNLVTTGIYIDTLTNAQGCDSFLYLNLYVKPISTTIMNAAICQQDSYRFNSRILYIAGTYRDTFVSSVNCDSIVILNLIVHPLPLANAGSDKLRINCKGDSVFIGTPAIVGLSYNWSPNVNLSSTNTAQTWAKPIAQVDYILKVTNSSTSCFAYDTVKVKVQNINLFATIMKSNLKCFNDNSGKLFVRVSGGYRPYNFWVENQILPQLDSNIIGLKAGSGFYRVEDAKGCELRDTFSLTEPAKIQITLASKKNLKCFQDNQGEIEVQVSGGTPSYDYTWSRSSQNSKKITNLPAGVHALTVSDDSGCIANFMETLTEPQNIFINPVLTANKCFGESKGVINLQVSQATPPFTYSWNIDSTNNKISNLKAGRYSVTIIDNNLCVFKHSDTLIDPEKLKIDSITTIPNGCGEKASGQLAIYANGGTPNYLYSIDSGTKYNRDSVFTRLEAAKYNIVVRDFNGCMVNARDSVKGYALLSVNITPNDTTILLGQEVQLKFILKEGNVQWIKDIQWSPSDGLSCTDCYEPRVSIYTTQTFKVRIKYFRDCYVDETVRIRVNSIDTFFIPTAFSPDAIISDENKVLRVYGNNIAVARMSIFNRWGEKLFEVENAHLEGWDGRYKDQDMPRGVYFYYCEIEFLDRRKLVKTGEVNLIR